MPAPLPSSGRGGCVLLSGCEVGEGMEKVDEAKKAQKQAEDVRRELEKSLKKGQPPVGARALRVPRQPRKKYTGGRRPYAIISPSELRTRRT